MNTQLEKLLRDVAEARSPGEQAKAILDQVKVSELLDYQDFVNKIWVYDAHEHGGMPELGYAALKLTGEAGEVAEKVGKAYRDSGGEIRDDLAFLRELGDVLFYVTKLAAMRGKTLEDVARINVEKLTDRRDRGVLRGSGDDR